MQQCPTYCPWAFFCPQGFISNAYQGQKIIEITVLHSKWHTVGTQALPSMKSLLKKLPAKDIARSIQRLAPAILLLKVND